MKSNSFADFYFNICRISLGDRDTISEYVWRIFSARGAHMLAHSSRSRRGFTLVELLVVIGIIALLISILLPALSKARKQANTVKCLANMKQMGNAIVLYTNDWKFMMPYSGWGDFPGAGNKANYPNWLYDASGKVTPNPTNVFAEKDLKNGALYNYIGVTPIYRCPQDAGPWFPGKSQFISSYVMNGETNSESDGITYKITTFHGGDAIMWEIGTTSSSSNDPSNTPLEEIAGRHNRGTSVLYIDSHAEVVSNDRWNSEINKGPSSVFCDPKSNVGHWDGNQHTVKFQE
jgi:prepilin-type N-terminal cleavage/methylation domain-containing protein